MIPRLPRIRRVATLRRNVRMPVWADVALRLAAVLFLIFFVVLIHYWERQGLLDAHDGQVSFLDVVYFTMISITTTGFGDITPVSDKARLIEAVIVTPIRIAVLFIFVGTAYTFLIKRGWEKWRMARIQEQLTGHIAVLGFGVSGYESVSELIQRGTDPSDIVVMDPLESRLSVAAALGCNVIAGDATRNETLIDIRVANARAILVSAGRDDTSILIVLTVRHLAPHVPISVVVRAEDNELLAHRAGADNVINPVRFTGLLLAGSAQGTHVADYLSDLASVAGSVQLVERPVRTDEIGGSLSQLATGGLGVRLYRKRQPYGYWTPEAQNLQPGDTIVEIVHAEKDAPADGPDAPQDPPRGG